MSENLSGMETRHLEPRAQASGTRAESVAIGRTDPSAGWWRPAHLVLLRAVLALAMVFPGCRSHPSRTIAVVPETTATELWEAMHAGAERAGRESGFYIYWNAPTREDDVEKQIAFVERVVHNQDAGLILAPDQYLALVAPVREVLASHIPTVIVRSPLSVPPGRGLSYILNDEDATGRIAARRLGTLLKGQGTVALLGIDPNVTGIVLRAHAFAAELANRFPHIVVVERRIVSPNSAEAQQAVEEILASQPHLDAILGLNAAATQGAWAALRALGKDRKIKLLGCDQEIELMASLRRGDIDSIIVENTNEMGRRAVQLIDEQTHGRTVPSEIKLPPTLVTQENIDTPEVQKMLSVNWRSNP